MTVSGVRIKLNAAGLRSLERQVSARIAPLGPELTRIVNNGKGRPVGDLVSELSAAFRKVGVKPDERTVRVLARRVSAGESIDDLVG